MRSRQFRLGLAHFRNSKVVKTEVCRKMGLIVASENRFRSDNIGPLRESVAPRLIVFRDWMELREIEGDNAHRSNLWSSYVLCKILRVLRYRRLATTRFCQRASRPASR